MSTYNENIQWVEKSVESILNQTYIFFEFIIVLDNPNNIELKQRLEDYARNDKRIRLVINENNLGLVKSLNKALELCSGEYVARMDADDISDLTRLDQQLNFIEKNKLDFVFSSVKYIDEMDTELFISNSTPMDSASINKKLRISNISNHPTWFLKKEVYEVLNGYRNIECCEDYDFSLRALNEGYKIGKMIEPILKYRIRENGISQSNLYKQYLNAETLKQYNKNNLLSSEHLITKLNENKSDVSKVKEQQYLKMMHYFANSINALKVRRNIKGVYWGIKAILIDVRALKKYYELLKLNVR